MSVAGRIVWHDLMTNDVERAKRFYAELFAWRIKTEGEWAFIYTAEGEDHCGTVMAMQGPPRPSHWVPYIAVEDLAVSMDAIKQAGGKLHTGKLAAGKTGTFAMAADPQGAVFTAWQYADGHAGKPESDTPPPAGHFCWDELLTSDPDAATAFYAKALGLGSEKMSMPGMDYTLLLRGAKRPDGKPRQAGGLMKLPPGVPHPLWLSYVAVADCDQTMERAKRLGATLPMPAIEVPNIGRFTTILDPSMAAIGILGPNR
jgi:predicted enzyme related to lactoylglutathione lyase